MDKFYKICPFFLAKNIFMSFRTSMKIISRIKTYLNTPSKCFIPKCKAHCCTNAPLPEDFLPKHPNAIQRNIYSGINIGQNDPHDTFNSVIYNTTTNPIQLIGVDQNGNSVVGIPPNVLEELQIKSMEQIQKLMERYNQFDNYCPFITPYGRCNVYSERPQICRDFGTLPDAINQCGEKATPLEVMKLRTKGFIEHQKEIFKLMWQLMRGKNINKVD